MAKRDELKLQIPTLTQSQCHAAEQGLEEYLHALQHESVA
jgi:hypothetical protein